jgi:hypothetical protein
MCSFNDQILGVRVIVDIGVLLITSQHTNARIGQTAASIIKENVSIDCVMARAGLCLEGDILC